MGVAGVGVVEIIQARRALHHASQGAIDAGCEVCMAISGTARRLGKASAFRRYNTVRIQLVAGLDPQRTLSAAEGQSLFWMSRQIR